MRVLAIFAIIGLVSAQHGHLNQQHGGGVNYPNKGRSPTGGSSRMGLGNPFDYNPGQGLGFQQQHPSGNVNQVNHFNAGQAPVNEGGSSPGRTFDYAPVGQQPISNNVNHNNMGQAPATQGGSSQGMIIPDGPVQTGITNQVNMVGAGTPPDPANNNNPNSGEFNWDAAGGAIGAANNAPQAAGGNGGSSGANNNNQVAYAAAGQGQAGGNSGGFGGPAYSAGDNGAANAPIGGALLTDKAQHEAGKPQHLHGAVNVAPTIVGVVVAVVVLVGVVAVAAVFLVKQRASRMMVASV